MSNCNCSDTKPESTEIQTNDESEAQEQRECSSGNRCKCGEYHQPASGAGNHRESCTSPLKDGESCCCITDHNTFAADPHSNCCSH